MSQTTIPTKTASDILREFVAAYAYGLAPRLDAIWLQAVALQQGRPPLVVPEDFDPYPRHEA